MKRVLLVVLLLAAALAALLLFLARHTKPVIAAAPAIEVPTLPESGPSAVKLTYVELAASPHRNEQPGATQVYGWITRGDDGQPVSGGKIRLRFEDYSLTDATAAEMHATQPVGFGFRVVQVQEDGGWFVDLPGKCWIQGADFTPRKELEPDLVDYLAADISRKPTDAVILPAQRRFARTTLIPTDVTIDRPLERDALEVTFAASPGIQVRGLVFDARSAQPIAGAQVILKGARSNHIAAGTDANGGFEISGIDPNDLAPEDGMIAFLVLAQDHEKTVRKVAWEPGQACIPAFKVVLEPVSR